MNSLLVISRLSRQKTFGRAHFLTGPIGRRLISFEPLIFAVNLLQNSIDVFNRAEVEVEGCLETYSELIIAAYGLFSMQNANSRLSKVVGVWSSVPHPR